MTPAELRRAVIGAPAAGFRLVLKESDWPIICRDPAHWSISPGGKFFTHDDGTGSVTIEALC